MSFNENAYRVMRKRIGKSNKIDNNLYDFVQFYFYLLITMLS